MKKLLSIILSITMLLSMATVAFADGIDGLMQPAKIKVGINAQFPPFEYYDENGELYGFDIDLMNYIGERIGFEIEYVDMSFDKLIPAIMSGEVACAISAISITEERNNVIDYTIPYLSAKVTYFDGETSDTSIEQYGIVFPNNSAEKAKVLEAAGEPETSVYNQVNNALSDLIEDMTIEKLGEKYNLNKAADTDGFDYEYTVMPVPDNFDKTNMDKSELTSDGTPLAPPSDWALSEVEKAEALNITEKGEAYRYRMSITREEFCELAYNYIVEFGKELEVSNNHKFKDTDNEKIEALNSLGIIYGKSETEFAPNDLLTREEAATILNRLINVVHPDLASTELYFEFADSEQISDWSMSAIQRICNIGIMKGVGNNNFAPQDNYTTEQAIVTLVRVYANSGVSKNVIGGADGPTDIVVSSDAEYVLKVIDKDGNIILNDNDILSCAAMKGELTEGGGNEWFLELMLSEEGRNKFRVATKKVSEYPTGENYLAILVNDQVITNPSVMDEIDSEGFFITGDFTEESAKALETTINNGIYQ